MDILNQIADINKNWISRHITIFSLSGIMMIALNNVISSCAGSFYGGYFGYAPASEFELYFDMVIGITVFLYFCGYSIEIMSDKTCGLPDLHLHCFKTLLKCFPLIFHWFLLVFLLLYLANILIPQYCILFYFLFLFVLPWINIIPVYFGRDFNHRYEYYSLAYFFRSIFGNIFSIVTLALQTIFLSIFPVIIVAFLFIKSNTMIASNLSLALRILGISIGGYSIVVLYCAYLKSLALRFKFPEVNLQRRI